MVSSQLTSCPVYAALRAIMQNDPDQAIPIIEKMLSGANSPKVKDRALFVLSQSRSARARESSAGHFATPCRARACRDVGSRI